MAEGLPRWKRVLDLMLLLVAAPGVLLVGGIVAAIIKCGSPGPVFFRQTRVGFRGRKFTIYKFRTMQVDAETETHKRHLHQLIKSRRPMIKLDARKDPRLIPLGSVLRACGLDELPQLINVLRGDMSWVGPRPCIPYEYEMYSDWHRRRFNAVPGLTGLWQVSGKNRTSFEEMIQLDIRYSEQLNLGLDLKIILKTVPALWTQYADLRAAQRKEPEPVAAALGKPIQPYQL